jgi:hypothetical protein
MAQYLLSVHNDYTAAPPTPERMQGFYDAVGRFNEELKASGAWVFAGGLDEPSTAAVVSFKDGARTDAGGPYQEGAVQLGGFWVIEASEMDAAMSWAALASEACGAPIEVRPFQGV